MKVLFAPPRTDKKFKFNNNEGSCATGLIPNYATYLLAAVAKKENFAVEIVDCAVMDANGVKTIVESAGRSDAVCLSANSYNWAETKKIIENIKANHHWLPIISGGIHPTIFDQHVLKTTPVDFIIRGEGEKTLPKILRFLDRKNERLEKISGISYKVNGEIRRNKDSGLLTDRDLEELPYPLFEKMPPGKFSALPLETSRGMPFYSPFHALPGQRIWRCVSHTRIFELLRRSWEQFIEKTISGFAYIVDNYFTAKEKRIHDFCKLLIDRKKTFKIAYQSRCSDIINENLMEGIVPLSEKIILDAGCGYNQGLLNLKKGFDIGVIADSAKILQKYKIAPIAFYIFMIGFPWEDRLKAEKTLDFARELCLQFGVNAKIEFCQSFPGSIYWDGLYSSGKINAAYYDLPQDYQDINNNKLLNSILTEKDYEILMKKIEEIATMFKKDNIIL